MSSGVTLDIFGLVNIPCFLNRVFDVNTFCPKRVIEFYFIFILLRYAFGCKESPVCFVVKIRARSFVWHLVGKAISSGACSTLCMDDGLCNFVALLSNEIQAWSLLWRKNFILF